MRVVRTTLLQSILPALALLVPIALAQHSHGESHEDMKVDMSVPAAAAEPRPDRLPSYFAHSEHVNMILAHIVLTVIAWVIVLPVAVMMSIAGSRLKIVAQASFLAVNGLGLFAGLVYNASTPDLYPGNAHHTLGWVVTWMATIWSAMGVVTLYTQKKTSASGAEARSLLSASNATEYERLETDSPTGPSRWSGDSEQQTLYSNSRSNSWNSNVEGQLDNEPKRFAEDEDDFERTQNKPSVLRNTRVDAFLTKHAARLAYGLPLKIFNFNYVLLERLLLVLGFVGILTGMVTYGRTGWDHGVFSTLAHLIKGGIFFIYGLLTFGRWMGCFADFGWAWNMKPGKDVVGEGYAWIPSAEFTESFVIALYGASNVFLEHLGNAGTGVWSAEDFEHISITVMFFGGGCLGMLVDSNAVRILLNTSVNPGRKNSEEYKQPKSYVHSLNPMPGLIIMLLGIMMSSHTQASHVAGMMHKLWGTLFVGFALSRGVSYVMMWLKPPQSVLPTRPPSELIAAFCLISGGVLFMASNEETVAAMEQYGLNAMIFFTVTMGFTGLLMAWVMVTVLLKNWIVQRSLPPIRAGQA